MDLPGTGRVLITIGVVIVVFGFVLLLSGKGVLPRLPGDLSFGNGRTRIYVPLGTSILVSVILTVVLNLFLRR